MGRGGASARSAQASIRSASTCAAHGESAWHSEGDYRLECHAEDLHGIVQTLDQRPALVGASLGGMVSLVYEGELYPGSARAVVFVDITPSPEREGVERVIAFMRSHPEGFASVEEAARAVSAYLPHRPPPSDTSGLERNLRLGDDGRWALALGPCAARWDRAAPPVEQLPGPAPRRRARDFHSDHAGARRMSDVVSEQSAREFLELVPHAEYVDVADAAHMVAGDSNDAFSGAVVEFLSRTLDASAPAA
jgi:pimeloyl-ACP methyl ester carboxylesterase